MSSIFSDLLQWRHVTDNALRPISCALLQYRQTIVTRSSGEGTLYPGAAISGERDGLRQRIRPQRTRGQTCFRSPPLEPTDRNPWAGRLSREGLSGPLPPRGLRLIGRSGRAARADGSADP